VKQVEEVFVRLASILHLHVGGQVIRTTAEHPFYVRDKGWVPAGQLAIGDLLSSHDGRWVAVEDFLDTGEYETVYNLRVADYHTYFVGGEHWGFSVWSHNSCFRALNEADAASIEAGERIKPKGEGGSIIDQIRGGTDTKYISVSKTLEGTAKYTGSAGVVEIDLAILKQTGSGIVPHEQVLQQAQRWGGPRDVANVIASQEMLITRGIDPRAIIRTIIGN
jgi:Pretoxin HINT domain